MKAPRSPGLSFKAGCFLLGPHSTMVAAAAVAAASIFVLSTELRESEGFMIKGT